MKIHQKKKDIYLALPNYITLGQPDRPDQFLDLIDGALADHLQKDKLK